MMDNQLWGATLVEMEAHFRIASFFFVVESLIYLATVKGLQSNSVVEGTGVCGKSIFMVYDCAV